MFSTITMFLKPLFLLQLMGAEDYLRDYLKQDSFFQNKVALQPNYHPEDINHRENEITKITKILAPILKGHKPSNVFMYGKTGTGKTLCAKHVIQQINTVANENNKKIITLYVNCKLKRVADTEYRLVAELARMLGTELPITGLPTDEVYNVFFKIVNIQECPILLILDEIDQLVKKAGDDLIYNLTRINGELEKSHITLVGISNDLSFADNLDPRVKSSLSEEELIFPPYNAPQIQDILRQRSEKAFKKNTVEQGVVEKCAAYAARDHGDARRALELLRVAGEIAEREGKNSIALEQIDEAEDKIERDRVVELVKNQPKQFQACLYSIIQIVSNSKDEVYTGDVYEFYKQLCDKTDLRPLTQRRISDIIGEFDMFGVVNAKIVSKGRYGRTREIKIGLPQEVKKKVLNILNVELGL